MANIHLTIATGDYDHLRDFTSGEVKADGIDITHLKLHVLEIFHRMTDYREFAGYDEGDVAEALLSLHEEARLLPDRHAALLDLFKGIGNPFEPM